MVDGGVDFFPYADNVNSWWVGYYVSRPLLKQMINRAFYTLKAADALVALARPWASAWQAAAERLVRAARHAQHGHVAEAVARRHRVVVQQRERGGEAVRAVHGQGVKAVFRGAEAQGQNALRRVRHPHAVARHGQRRGEGRQAAVLALAQQVAQETGASYQTEWSALFDY
jgi:hypothetical protein